MKNMRKNIITFIYECNVVIRTSQQIITRQSQGERAYERCTNLLIKFFKDDDSMLNNNAKLYVRFVNPHKQPELV